MDTVSTRDSVCVQIAELAARGVPLVIVHGGGKEISQWSERLGIKPRWAQGYRITDDDAMNVTEMVLSGLVNGDITSRLCRAGVTAIGVSGRSCRLLRAERLVLDDGTNMERSGDIQDVDPLSLRLLLSQGLVPVVSPVAEAADGTAMNINADIAAAVIAAKLKSPHCIFLSDVDGVRRGGEVAAHLTGDEIMDLIRDGGITGGMIPKVDCALRALSNGCARATIANANVVGIVTRIVGGESVGTRIEL